MTEEKQLPGDTTDISSAEQATADELAIRLIVDEIDNACDTKDWERCRSFFTGQITVDFTSLAGGEPGLMPADELVDSWNTNLYAEKKTFHQRSNHRIEIDGDRAAVWSKAYAFNLLESGEVQGMWEVWGIYEHGLERVDGSWKVSSMTLKVVHRRGDEKVREYVPPEN